MSDWNSGAESSSSDSQGVGEGGGRRAGRLGSSKDQSEEPIPEADVAEWTSRLRAKTLSPKDLIDFFKGATPPLFLVDSARNPSDLGELLAREKYIDKWIEGGRRGAIDLILSESGSSYKRRGVFIIIRNTKLS